MELTKEQLRALLERWVALYGGSTSEDKFSQAEMTALDRDTDLALRGLGGTTQEPVAQVEPCELCGADMIHVSRASDYAAPAAPEAGSEPLAVTEEGASIKLALEHALSTLECGRAFIDVDQTERDNWKGHATIVEDEIKAILSQCMNKERQGG